jgi:3D (Asp-Asp-Asp) domain-containing protein
VDKATGRSKRVGQTASGSQARYGTIAAPAEYPFGTIMYVEGYGYGRVEDRGGLIKGNKLDLFFSSHRQAQNWGKRQRTVKIWFPDKRASGSGKTTPPPSGTGAKLRK